MIVVADSGSTKADWVIISEEKQRLMHTMGFNPIYHDEETIYSNVKEAFRVEKVAFEEIEKIFYYGTAVWDDEKRKRISTALEKVAPNASVQVKHDLLGAARAACGREPGIVCIMGTGSNTCSYDGTVITDNVTNLGYFVGDEGSGAHLGKELLRSYFYRELPPELHWALEKKVPGGKEEFLGYIYSSDEKPNVYLAGLTKFMSDHIDHFFIQKIIYKSFSEFIDRQVRKYRGHMSVPIHFIGSIAFYFQEQLRLVLEERNMKTGKFVKKPIDELVQFHLEFPDI